MLVPPHQTRTPLLVHPATVGPDRLNSPLIQWKVVTLFCQHLRPMGLTTNHGPVKTPVAMRPTWNRTQVQPSEGYGTLERLGNQTARTDYVKALVRATYCSP